MKPQLAEFRRAFFLLAFLSGPAFATFPDCVFVAGGDSWEASAPPEWRANLMAHNCARRQVSPAATTPIQPLKWSNSIAAQAQAHSAQCIWAHSGTSGLGENIYGSTALSDQRLAAAMLWAAENVSYNHAANTCAPGQICGHYTQMVWANTTQLGCGTTNCSTGSPFGGAGNWNLTVCNYSPPGNYVGQRPY